MTTLILPPVNLADCIPLLASAVQYLTRPLLEKAPSAGFLLVTQYTWLLIASPDDAFFRCPFLSLVSLCKTQDVLLHLC